MPWLFWFAFYFALFYKTVIAVFCCLNTSLLGHYAWTASIKPEELTEVWCVDGSGYLTLCFSLCISYEFMTHTFKDTLIKIVLHDLWENIIVLDVSQLGLGKV